MTLEQQQKFEDEWRGPCPNPRRPNWKPCVRRSSFPLDARALSALPGARFDSAERRRALHQWSALSTPC
jgi:hypothetical protein